MWFFSMDEIVKYVPQNHRNGMKIRKKWDVYVQMWMMILYYHSHVASPLQWLEPTLLSREFGRNVKYALDRRRRG